MSSDDIWERIAKRFETPPRRWQTPGEMARTFEKTTVSTPALELIDEALVRLFDTPDGRLIITMPPQEGKSTRVAKDFPTWCLSMRPDTRIVTASYGQGLANRNGRFIRNNIIQHPELGISIADDNGSVSEWSLAGHLGGVLSVGIGSGVTGRAADMLIIDDPIKDRKEADSDLFRDTIWDWWTDAAATRLAPGAPVVVILTRWHHDDLAGRLVKAEDGSTWEVLNIPAQAEDSDPEKGIPEDPLDREPGQYMISARARTLEQWEAIKRRSGARTWNALYQGRPSNAQGNMFLRNNWKYFTVAPWIVRSDGKHVLTEYDELSMSWDLTFKDTDGADMVVGQVWMRRNGQVYLLDQVRDRMDFVRTCFEFRQLAAKWPQAILKLVEDKANGPAVISMLNRTVPGIVPEEPQGSKSARAAAVSPLQEAGNILLPDPSLAPWVGEFVEECAAFPTGAHDDQVDAMSQAINRMVLQPLLLETEEPEEYNVYDIRGYYASPV